jgi:AbrB family looped-hinge helix DNA binding protein
MNGENTKIGEGGRVVIPAEFRRALGLETGDEIIVRLQDGAILILTRAEAVRRAQAAVRKHIKRGRSLVTELQNERRAESKDE